VLRRGSPLVPFEVSSPGISRTGLGRVERGGHPELRGCRRGFLPRDGYVAELRNHIAGREPAELMFNAYREAGQYALHTGFHVAAVAIGIPELHPQKLRHTAASLAIASGADVKVVQQMLGLSSAAINAQNPVLPNADVVDLAAYKAKGKTAGQAPNPDGAPGEIRTRAPASGGRCSIP
jgi:hypothetical protein